MISHLAESVSFRYGWGREIMREERSRIRDQRSEGEGGRWGVIAESLFVLVCLTRDAMRRACRFFAIVPTARDCRSMKTTLNEDWDGWVDIDTAM